MNEITVRVLYALKMLSFSVFTRSIFSIFPSNQVTSSDKVMVCNFETAVQTDPATCTLLVSHSLIAPSNRMGLSPEVLNTFNRWVHYRLM
jgi:hypothetical protein